MKFKAREVYEHGHFEDDFIEIEAFDAEEAAEKYHELMTHEEPQYYGKVIKVEVEGHGTWETECEMTPTFSAMQLEDAGEGQDGD